MHAAQDYSFPLANLNVLRFAPGAIISYVGISMTSSLHSRNIS